MKRLQAQSRAPEAALLGVVAFSLACSEPTSIQPPVATTPRIGIDVLKNDFQYETSIGCGVTFSLDGEVSSRLTVPRTALPRTSSPSALHRAAKPRMARYQLVSVTGLAPLDGQAVDATCAIPDYDVAADLSDLRRAVTTYARQNQVARIATEPSKRSQLADWRLDALFAEPLLLKGKPQVSTFGGKASSSPEVAGLVIGGTAGAYAAMVVYNWGHSLFFDWRNINAIYSSLLGNYPEAEVQVISWSGIEELCLTLSETWTDLDILEQEVDAAIHALTVSVNLGEDFDTNVLCPDSLMDVGDYCLDSYIASPNVYGVKGWGNGRNSDPYAGINESKVQFIPDFEGGNHWLAIGTSPNAWIPAPLIPGNGSQVPPNGGWMVGGPGDSALMVTKYEVLQPSADVRVVELNAQNAICSDVQFSGQTGPFSGMWNGFVNLACPGISWTATFTKVAGKWIPTQVQRDAFPTLDVIEKTSSGLVVIDHSPEGNLGLVLLSGYGAIKYDIQQRKEELLDEFENSMCEMQ